MDVNVNPLEIRVPTNFSFHIDPIQIKLDPIQIQLPRIPKPAYAELTNGLAKMFTTDLNNFIKVSESLEFLKETVS